MFFAKKDSDQQGLDINIGRVLEMFRTNVLDAAQAREALTKFFGGEAQKDLPLLQSHLTNVLAGVDSGALDLTKARNSLVNAAAASEKHDPHYAVALESLLAPPVAHN